MDLPLFVIPFLFIAGALAIIGVVTFFTSRYERQRTAELQEAAQALGLEFLETSAEHTCFPASLGLFDRGRSRQAWNVIHGQTQDVSVRIFDYRFTTGSGKSRRTHKQTVAAIESESLHLPQFMLRPETWLDKVASAIGFEDIDFSSRPEFSRRCHLSGAKAAEVRRRFTPAVLEFFEQHPGVSAEGDWRWLICYWTDKRVQPADLRELLGLTLRLHSLLKTTAPAASPPASSGSASPAT